MNSRRGFISIISSGIVFLVIFIWKRLTLAHINSLQESITTIPFDKTSPVTFFEDYILVIHNDTPQLFSSRCTHLGCTIRRMENGKLVCPCHGSEYNTDGIPVKGPAHEPLQQMEFELSEDQKSIQVIV